MSLIVRAVRAACERVAPLRLAEKWDNVGLLLETPSQRENANRILLTIDVTPEVVEEALATPTAMIVAYHPIIFRPIPSLTLAKPMQKSILTLASKGISVYCPHTSLDAVWGGINDWLAKAVTQIADKQNSSAQTKLLGEPAAGGEGTAGRLVTIDQPIDLYALVESVKSLLHLEQVQVGFPAHPRKISTVAICAGAGGSLFAGVEADAYFTGEMAHHEVLAAVGAGRYVILCGHTNTERGYLPIFSEKLHDALESITQQRLGPEENFSDTEMKDLEKLKLEISISQADKHPLLYL